MEVFKNQLTVSVKWIVLLLVLGISITSLAQSGSNPENAFPGIQNKTADPSGVLKESEELQSDIAKYRRSGSNQALVTTLSRYAQICYDLNLKEKCLPVYHELIDIGSEMQDIRLLTRAYADLGSALKDLRRYDSSMYYSFKALKLAESIHNDTVICLASNCLGGIYNFKKNYAKSLELHSKALEYAEKMKSNVPLYLTSLVNTALAYSWLNIPVLAVALDLRALPLAEKSSNYKAVSIIKMNLASNYAALHQNDKAINYLEDLLQNLPAYHLNPADQCEKVIVSGIIYWDMRMVNKAKYYLNQQLPVASGLKNYNMLQRIYDSLGVIAEYEKQYPDALRYFKLSKQFKDSISAGENRRMVSELEVNYQTAQKEKALSEKQLQLVQKDAQIKQDRYYTYFILAGMALLVLIILLLYYNYQNRKKEHLRTLQLVEQQKEYQLLQALIQGEEKERSRIARDLHDSMSGMLAAAKMHINSLPLKEPAITNMEGYNQAVTLLDQVAAGIRKTSHHLMPEVLFQLGLDEALRRYCIQLNNKDVLQVQYDSFGVIARYNDRFELSVYRIVQELLNNIVRHSNATEVVVQLSVHEQLMSITVEDNGIGLCDEYISNGTGLSNLEARVKALNGTVQMDSHAGSGLQVYLEFDVRDSATEVKS